MELQTYPTKSARLTVLLSPDDKRQIEQRARGLDMSVGEYLRRASRFYEPELDNETLEAALELWASNMEYMRDRLAETLASLEEKNAEMKALREARSGIR